jgi:hypothetical protein
LLILGPVVAALMLLVVGGTRNYRWFRRKLKLAPRVQVVSSSAVVYRDYQLRAVEHVDRPPAGVLPGVRQAGRQGMTNAAELLERVRVISGLTQG